MKEQHTKEQVAMITDLLLAYFSEASLRLRMPPRLQFRIIIIHAPAQHIAAIPCDRQACNHHDLTRSQSGFTDAAPFGGALIQFI